MHVVDDVTRSVFWKPFASCPAAVPESERERLREAGRAAIRDAVVPAYRDFLAFMRDRYIPHPRANIAAADLPDGPALYALPGRHFPTLHLAPQGADAIRPPCTC